LDQDSVEDEVRRGDLVRAIDVLILTGSIVAVSGCHQWGGAPDNGLVQVANLASADATFHWQSPGVLGTAILGGSGTEPINACSLLSVGFAPGDQQLTITSSHDTKTFTLAAPSAGQVVLWVVIKADGTIAETTESQAPASPYCGG
jgi:hypothetical protein